MIVYLDSSVLARAYLADEEGHAAAAALLDGRNPLVTSTWTPVEVTSALVRAIGAGRVRAELDSILAALAADTGPDGPVTLLRVDMARLEQRALSIVRDHGLRSLDALHLAVADLAARALADPDEQVAFASRDNDQMRAAEALGFTSL